MQMYMVHINHYDDAGNKLQIIADSQICNSSKSDESLSVFWANGNQYIHVIKIKSDLMYMVVSHKKVLRDNIRMVSIISIRHPGCNTIDPI